VRGISGMSDVGFRLAHANCQAAGHHCVHAGRDDVRGGQNRGVAESETRERGRGWTRGYEDLAGRVDGAQQYEVSSVSLTFVFVGGNALTTASSTWSPPAQNTFPRTYTARLSLRQHRPRSLRPPPRRTAAVSVCAQAAMSCLWAGQPDQACTAVPKAMSRRLSSCLRARRKWPRGSGTERGGCGAMSGRRWRRGSAGQARRRADRRSLAALRGIGRYIMHIV